MRLCAYAPMRLCAYAPMRLCAYAPMAHSLWPTAYGPQPMTDSLWPMAYGLWPIAYGRWPMADGLRGCCRGFQVGFGELISSPTSCTWLCQKLNALYPTITLHGNVMASMMVCAKLLQDRAGMAIETSRAQRLTALSLRSPWGRWAYSMGLWPMAQGLLPIAWAYGLRHGPGPRAYSTACSLQHRLSCIAHGLWQPVVHGLSPMGYCISPIGHCLWPITCRLAIVHHLSYTAAWGWYCRCIADCWPRGWELGSGIGFASSLVDDFTVEAYSVCQVRRLYCRGL